MSSDTAAGQADYEEHGRALLRTKVVWQGLVHMSGFVFSCQLRNLSSGGAKVKLDAPLQCGSLCTLEIPKYNLTLGATVIWHKDGFIGMQFLDDDKTVRAEFIRGATIQGLEPVTFMNVMR